MLFNSIEYGVFLAIVLALHFLLPHRFRWGLLLAASYFFYMQWNPLYALLIAASTAVDYTVGLRLATASRPRERRMLLVASLAVNLGLLFTFKYWNFFQDSAAWFAAQVGVAWEPSLLDVLLPVGISFYTLQTLGYTIDVYRGVISPERHLGRFALFVAFFPQLVAGPIERARRFLPQIPTEKRFDLERVSSGLQLVLWGLFKKVVIADRLSVYVDAVYGDLGAHGATDYWLATYAFAWQIYCDFSGYSDMAIGSARILGFDLMKNFDLPYFATSITALWRKWHISLSTWLRDYLYIPLGGNRRGLTGTYRNLLLTMVLGGLWHGAHWNYVTWGAVHGVLLAASRATLPTRDRLYARVGVPRVLRDAVRMLITFHLVCFAYVFFRSADLEHAWRLLTGLFGPFDPPRLEFDTLGPALLGFALLLAVQIVQARWGSVRELVRPLPAPVRWAGWYTLGFLIFMFGAGPEKRFIYFQF